MYVLHDLRLLLRGEHCDVALAERAVYDDITRACERVRPRVLFGRLKRRGVGRRGEGRTPETEAELRRALLVPLDAVAQLGDPGGAVPGEGG